MSFLAPFDYEFFRNGFIAAVIIGALCGAAGMFMSFFFDISSAATIVLTAAAIFIAVVVFRSVSGGKPIESDIH